MNETLSNTQATDLVSRGFTRRSFGRIAAMITAGATMPFYNEPALAQFALGGAPIPPDAVRINLNENPLGPCTEALEAIHGISSRCGRYLIEETTAFERTFAELEGVKPNRVAAFAGSSTPLHHAVLAFTGPNRSLVMGDPGYDAVLGSAKFIGSKAVKVPLTKSYAHDVRAMAAAAAETNAGLIFLCNPNNPTGSITKTEDIDWLVANKPKGSVLLLDEAYIQFYGDPRGAHYVNQDEDVIVLRTFSKLYGMAGLRAGVAMAKPELLSKVRSFSSGPIPATSVVAAHASIKARGVVSKRRKIMRNIREDVSSFFEKHHFSFVHSEAAMLMVDVRKPGAEFTAAMRKEKVLVGRSWPAWPTHVRISLGTQAEMDKFKTAFLKVMA